MRSGFTHRMAIVAAGAALAAGGALTGCSPTTEKDAPATSTSTFAPAATTATSTTATSTTATSTTATSSATAPSVSPTEKVISPGGDNSFSPTVNPGQPGSVCNEIVNGVCVR